MPCVTGDRRNSSSSSSHLFEGIEQLYCGRQRVGVGLGFVSGGRDDVRFSSLGVWPGTRAWVDR